MATSLMDMYGQQSGMSAPQTSIPGTTSSNNSNPWSNINWSFYSPDATSGMDNTGVNPVKTGPQQLYNLGDQFYKDLGYTGQAWNPATLDQTVSGGNDQGTINPEFVNWLKSKNYQFGEGIDGSTPWRGYFDVNKNPVGIQKGSSDTGAIEHFILNALAMYAGGQAFAGATGAEGFGAGLTEGGGADALAEGAAVGGSDPGFVWNAAADSQAANLGGADVWGAAGGGMSGAPISAGGAVGSVPAGVDLGGLGGALATGAGASAVPAIFNNAKDSQGANEQLGLPPVTDATKPAIPGGTNNLSDLFSSGKLQDLITKGLGSALGGLTSPDGLKGLLGIYNANQQKDLWDKQFANIDQMFSPNSPYAKQMEETLARKDSAAGRNSQYGPRAQALASDLTGQKARMVSDLNNIISKQQDMMQSRATDVASILQSTGLLNGLSSGVSSLFTELFDLLNGD